VAVGWLSRRRGRLVKPDKVCYDAAEAEAAAAHAGRLFARGLMWRCCINLSGDFTRSVRRPKPIARGGGALLESGQTRQPRF
jgi:hypothetical protein